MKCTGRHQQLAPAHAIVRLPTAKKPNDPLVVELRDHKNEFEYPIIESLDIETFCDKRGDERVYAENSRVAAIGAHSMGIEGFEPDEIAARGTAAGRFVRGVGG
jgi:hypothetical protein